MASVSTSTATRLGDYIRLGLGVLSLSSTNSTGHSVDISSTSARTYTNTSVSATSQALDGTAVTAGTAPTAHIHSIPSTALACQSSLLAYSLAVSSYETTATMGPGRAYFTTYDTVNTRSFPQLEGTADVYTTISGIPYAHGTFTATASSEIYMPHTSWQTVR